jgi:hypothetical protein
MAARDRLPRFLLLLTSLLLLMLGLSAGLTRLGWSWAWAPPALAGIHGPLMICGFLGTLICLERAVALGRWWGYAAPLLTGVGTLGLVAGVPARFSSSLIAIGSLALVFIFIAIVRKQPTFHAMTMSLGAGAWLTGNVLWFSGVSIPQVAQWWIGFLVLTIAGERLELNRLLAPSRFAKRTFGAGLILFVAGLICGSILPVYGNRIAGLGMLALALWLVRFDVVRFTVRKAGLSRFIALCLLAGYAWLAVGGLLWILAVPTGVDGDSSFFMYDARLHSIFLGFVFSMIFAHAPIVFPAVVGRPLAFRKVFYVHVLLLHLSLIARMAGDLAGFFPAVQWAGVGNVIALVLFLVNNAYAMLAGRSEARTLRRPSAHSGI